MPEAIRAGESEHYKPLFPECEVVGLGYQTFTPWETGKKIREAEVQRRFEMKQAKKIPIWLYIWIGIIALIKVVNIISGFTVQKTFVAVHSAMNKATGVLLFLLPLTIPVLPLKNSVIVVCAAATFAAIQEGHLIRTGEITGQGG